jgi:hypothetical protein
LKLLNHKKLKIAEHAIRGISNFAAIRNEFRDELIEKNAIERLIKIAKIYKSSRIFERCC